MRVISCSLVCLYALQVDERVLWDYWGLAASWGMENCDCHFGGTGSLPQVVAVGTGVLVVVGPVPRSGGWPPLSGSGAWVPGCLKPRLHSSFPRVGLHPFGWLAV